METLLNRHIEKAVFNYLPDVYLYFGLSRCVDIVNTEHPAVNEEDRWKLIAEKYDSIASIILKGVFQITLNCYKPISEFDRYTFLNKYNITGYYQYGFDLILDLANYWDKNKKEIIELGYNLEDFVNVCVIFSYNKVRQRISESKNSQSNVLHKFTSNDIDTNLNIYLSLKAFMSEGESSEWAKKELFKPYLNSYLKNYDLEIVDKEKLSLSAIDSDFIVGASNSIIYGLNVNDLKQTFDDPKIISGFFWRYERKTTSFYTAETPVASMTHSPILNLFKCLQINLENFVIS